MNQSSYGLGVRGEAGDVCRGAHHPPTARRSRRPATARYLSCLAVCQPRRSTAKSCPKGTLQVEGLLPRFSPYLEPALRSRDGTRPAVVVGTVGIVRLVQSLFAICGRDFGRDSSKIEIRLTETNCASDCRLNSRKPQFPCLQFLANSLPVHGGFELIRLQVVDVAPCRFQARVAR